MIRSVLRVCTVVSAMTLGSVAQAHDEPKINEAVVVLVPKTGGEKVSGTLTLKQEKGFVLVSGEVKGLTPGKHGFHIHMFGDLRAADGMSLGGHYNPKGHAHGGPDSKERHEGDLGNIEANDAGVAKVEAKAMGLELHHVVGRSIVVHGKADDLKSQPAGDAGPRIAVGVIGLAEVPAKK